MWAVAYVISIVAVNWLFNVIPTIGVWQPTSVIVGLVFIFRDLAQRKIGHWVLPVMLVGGAISYIMADPFVAIASVTAFLVSEGLDWIIYTVTKRPLRDRILFSSAVGTPVDSIVFTAMIGILSPINVIVMTASKMVGALVIWGFMKSDKE
ncbi:MAG: preQ0 transporter [Acidiferrobacteraceae bacterium]|jgi:hypothetical protein|nr:preQ0 transporter [Acidiferrobacteraceae bacterium]MDP6435407.1 hypothetical protein [Arenicellales bacterium]MDP6723652.1 hypothetical protein [Arenicellales bacterium]|tara:strand:- start:30981 stop:31433 length:453 start_codon:yes stop_codon:yes gene_type:complete